MIVKEYFLNSSIHGFHFIADEKYHWTERIFWVACVIGSWIGSYTLINNVLEQYRTQTVTFDIDTSYLDWVTDFPAIIFCETANKEKLEKFKTQWFGNSDDAQELFAAAKQLVFFRGTFSEDNGCYIKSSNAPKCLLTNLSHYLNEVRSPCSELFTSCYYNDHEFSCCDEIHPIDSCYGSCFAFNSLAYRHLEKIGVPFKIRRNVNNGYGNLSIETSKTNFYLIALDKHSVPSMKNVKMQLLGSDNDHAISMDYSYDVYLSIIEIGFDDSILTLDDKGRSCMLKEENNLHLFEHYSLAACQNECVSNAHYAICNCRLHTYPNIDKNVECNATGISCIISSTVIIENHFEENCDCHTSCFNMEVALIGEVKNNFADKKQWLRDEHSVVKFNFYVQAPSVKYARTLVRNPLDLLVSTGGTVGLFIGASLLTVIEIIYYFFIRPCGDKYLQDKKRLFQRNKRKTVIVKAKPVQKPFPFVN